MPQAKRPRPSPRRGRTRHPDDAVKAFADSMTAMIGVVDRAARRLERLAHKTPPAEMARARALLEAARRGFEESRREVLRPLDLPGLTRAVRPAPRGDASPWEPWTAP